jgi:integrase
MKALSQDEFLKVLRAASNNPRDLAMILIAFRHGMRASEVCGLEMKDVDLKNGEITIRRLKGSLKTTQPLAEYSLRRQFRIFNFSSVLPSRILKISIRHSKRAP